MRVRNNGKKYMQIYLYIKSKYLYWPQYNDGWTKNEELIIKKKIKYVRLFHKLWKI